MSAVTPRLGLYKPGGGSTGLITPDEVADIDRLNANSDVLDAWAITVEDRVGVAGSRVRDFRGPAANIGAVPSPVRGDTYQETDGNFVTWKHDGTNWITNEGGMFLIRPASVVNGVINADGSVSPSAAQNTFSLNGVFSTRFRAFKIVSFVDFPTAAAFAFRLRVGGVDAVTNYQSSKLYSNAGAAPAVVDVATAAFEHCPTASLQHYAGAELIHPADSVAGKRKFFTAVGRGVGTNTYITTAGATLQNDTVAYDGLTVYAYAPVTNFGILSWVKVYGIL